MWLKARVYSWHVCCLSMCEDLRPSVCGCQGIFRQTCCRQKSH